MIPPTTAKNAPLRLALAKRYLQALRLHLGKKGPATAAIARPLGRAALAANLVTLDLAIIHEEAILALASRFDFINPRLDFLKRAGQFFTQALIPLEAHVQATRETNRQLQERNATLRRHTAALALSNRRLEREIARRQAGQATILRAKERYRALFLQSQLMQEKLRKLTRQILSAQEEERKAISRELHDEVVQTLVGINVELAALSEGASSGMPKFKAKIARTQSLVTHSVNAVHRFARELRPAVLDDLGLIPALHVYCTSLAKRKKLKISITAFQGVETLSTARRTVLFRITQEALTNVVRHAEATQVDLVFTSLPGTVRMEITDNGKSFPVEKTLLAKNFRRLGLVGMRERVEMVGGCLVIESTPGHGTTVRAEIPFASSKKSS